MFPRKETSASDPVKINATEAEFESLLDFFYGGYVNDLAFNYVFLSSTDWIDIRMHNETTRPLLSWQNILTIATNYRMTRMRNRAIREIYDFRPRIDPIEQIVLAVKCGVEEWLPIAYTALCKRKDAIQLEEAEKIGIVITVKLNIARELIRKRSSVPPGASFDRYLVNNVIFEIFWPGDNVPEPESLDEDPMYQEFGAGEKQAEEMIEREYAPSAETFNSDADGDLIDLNEDDDIDSANDDKDDKEETEQSNLDTKEYSTSVPTGVDAPKPETDKTSTSANRVLNSAMATQGE